VHVHTAQYAADGAREQTDLADNNARTTAAILDSDDDDDDDDGMLSV